MIGIDKRKQAEVVCTCKRRDEGYVGKKVLGMEVQGRGREEDLREDG